MVNPVPCPVSPVDQVFNLVSSLVEPLTKVDDPVPSSISPTFHLKSETQVTDSVPSLVSPTLHMKSANMVNPNPPLTSAKVVALISSSVSPFDHVINMVMYLVEPVDKVIDPIPSSVDPTLPLESATQAVDPFPLFDPILPLDNETQVVNLMLLSIDPIDVCPFLI
jgi:hypothetical protein